MRNAIIAHDWGNNTMTMQGNGMVRTIVVIKHLGAKVKQPKMLLCYDYQNGIIDEEKDSYLLHNHKKTIRTISLPNTFQSIKTIKFNHTNIEIKNHNIEMNNTKFISLEGKITNRYKPKVVLKDKCVSINIL